jgi:hypothetical protein
MGHTSCAHSAHYLCGLKCAWKRSLLPSPYNVATSPTRPVLDMNVYLVMHMHEHLGGAAVAQLHLMHFSTEACITPSLTLLLPRYLLPPSLYLYPSSLSLPPPRPSFSRIALGQMQVFKNGTDPYFFCDSCLESFCSSCQASWHDGQTCEE